MEDNISALIERLADSSRYASPSDADVADRLSQELVAIQSIYGEDELQLMQGTNEESTVNGLKLLLRVLIPAKDDEIAVRLQISLPPGYPMSESPPKFQLLNRYLGRIKVSESVQSYVGSVFQSDSPSGIIWQKNESMLFEGIESLSEYLRDWYEARQSEQKGNETESATFQSTGSDKDSHTFAKTMQVDTTAIVRSEPILERKSEFLGHAIRIRHPDEVPVILSHILDSDKRIQRATHPIIHAWVCRTEDNVLHHGMLNINIDCDDDGETAAGGRLAHLLSLLVCVRCLTTKELENVLVVVTRWYGGVLLGPDRFKHINRVARDALVRAGFVESAPAPRPVKR